MYKKIIFILLALVFISPVHATDYAIPNVYGLGYTDYHGDEFMVTNNNASNGYAQTCDLQALGFYTCGVRIANGNNLLYAMSDPTTLNRVFFTDEQGNVGYIDNVIVDYSLGFYTYPTNLNPMYKIGTLSTTTSVRKITIDSAGNVYTNDGLVIKKFVKSLDYSVQTFYTLSAGVDFTIAAAPYANYILGIQMDASNNLHVLISSVAVSGGTGYLSKTVISPTGVRIKSDLALQSASYWTGTSGFSTGGLVIDSVNPMYNYTYSAYKREYYGVGAFIWHNSTNGTVDVGGGVLPGITSVNDIGYNNYQIYLASSEQNIIRTYATNYEGYGYAPSIPTNPDGITGTLVWLDPYGTSQNTLGEGLAMKVRYTISNLNPNYSYWVSYGADIDTYPSAMYELTQVNSTPGIHTFMSTTTPYAGSSIYGYLLSQRKNDSSWYRLTSPVKLTITKAAAGFDSITLNKLYYDNTGMDNVIATFTYSGGIGATYKWAVCTRQNCDGLNDPLMYSNLNIQPKTDTLTNNLPIGYYYAVLMKGYWLLEFLSMDVVDYKPLVVRPPLTGVRWHSKKYNIPLERLSTICNDVYNIGDFSSIKDYGGIKNQAWLSCSQIPAGASTNNSLMRVDFFSKYTSVVYLNNSFGNIFNTSFQGNGTLLYVLTPNSTVGDWAFSVVEGINGTSDITTVYPYDDSANAIWFSQKKAYVGDTIIINYNKPRLKGKIVLEDANGIGLQTWDNIYGVGATKYYVDPMIGYTFGTWTARMYSVFNTEIKSATIEVINGTKPVQYSEDFKKTPLGKTTEITDLLSSNMFWAFVVTVGMMITVGIRTRRDDGLNALPIAMTGLLGLASFTLIGWIPYWLLFSIILLIIIIFGWQQADKTKTGGG